MIYGYARVSTKKQAIRGNSLEEQTETLQKNGVQKIFADVYTGKQMERPELDKLLAVLQPGDMLIITKLDRIARTSIEGFETIKAIVDKGVTVNILNMGIADVKTAIGKATLQIMLAYAEMERDLIYERTQDGRVYKREHDPNYKEGRKPVPKKQLQAAIEDLKQYSYKESAERHGISVSTLQRGARRAGVYKSRM